MIEHNISYKKELNESTIIYKYLKTYLAQQVSKFITLECNNSNDENASFKQHSKYFIGI